jgi:hypothetical protein
VLRCRELLAVEHNPDHLDEVQRTSDRALVISNLDREFWGEELKTSAVSSPDNTSQTQPLASTN